MSVIMIRQYRVVCDTPSCNESEELTGWNSSRQALTDICSSGRFSIIKNKSYCRKCVIKMNAVSVTGEQENKHNWNDYKKLTCSEAKSKEKKK